MAYEPKEYAVLRDGNEMVAKLKELYPEVLWTVVPEEICVCAVINKERPESQKDMAKLIRVLGPVQALLDAHDVKSKFLIEVYGSDWQSWIPSRRAVVLMKPLLAVPSPNEKSPVKPDTNDYAVLIDAFGLDYWEQDSVINILDEDNPIKFKESLYLRLHKDGQED